MKLSIAVDQYVARKRIEGYAFSNEESRLARFCKSSGDLNISDLSCDHVVAYLDGSDVATVTWRDRKSTRLNSSHQIISYAVFCLKKKKQYQPCMMHLQGCDALLAQRHATVVIISRLHRLSAAPSLEVRTPCHTDRQPAHRLPHGR